MTNSKKDIFIETNKAIDILLEKKEQLLEREYIATLKRIKQTLANAYEKFGSDGILTREEMVRYGRLTKFEKYLIEQIHELTKTQIRITKESIREIFTESYYRYGYMIEQETGIQIYENLTNEEIDQNLYNEFHTIHWDERIKNNNQHLSNQLRDDIISALGVGITYAVLSDIISKRFNIGANKARKIVRTEGRRVQEKANLETIKKAKGVLEKYDITIKKQWVSAKDKRFRDTHRHLDGEIVGVDEKFTSKSGAKALAPRRFGVASEDINCRCTTITAFFDDNGKRIGARVMRARNHGDKQRGVIVPYQRYRDWIKDLDSRK